MIGYPSLRVFAKGTNQQIKMAGSPFLNTVYWMIMENFDDEGSLKPLDKPESHRITRIQFV